MATQTSFFQKNHDFLQLIIMIFFKRSKLKFEINISITELIELINFIIFVSIQVLKINLLVMVLYQISNIKWI